MNTPANIPPVTGAPGAFRLSARASDAAPYAPPGSGRPIDLFLDANEGPEGGVEPGWPAPADPDEARRYPCAAELESALADRSGVDRARVLVTAGGDDAIDRACRACLEPGRTLVLPVPTFEMIERSAILAGAAVVRAAWPGGPYPIKHVLGAIDDRTTMIAVVSPNNPTGAVASRHDLEALSAAAPWATLLVDLAYTEFADEDLTGAALALPNAVAIRTFSKAFGLAGLRVGYAIGPERLIHAMRAMGSPYPASSLSIAGATAALQRAPVRLPAVVARIRHERDVLAQTLRNLGARPQPSQANFVLARFDDAPCVWNSLASLGIAVRCFAPGKGLDDALRITCPGDEASFDRLLSALHAAVRPRATGAPVPSGLDQLEGLLP